MLRNSPHCSTGDGERNRENIGETRNHSFMGRGFFIACDSLCVQGVLLSKLQTCCNKPEKQIGLRLAKCYRINAVMGLHADVHDKYGNETDADV